MKRAEWKCTRLDPRNIRPESGSRSTFPSSQKNRAQDRRTSTALHFVLHSLWHPIKQPGLGHGLEDARKRSASAGARDEAALRDRIRAEVMVELGLVEHQRSAITIPATRLAEPGVGALLMRAVRQAQGFVGGYDRGLKEVTLRG
jgi:hypothetical protein